MKLFLLVSFLFLMMSCSKENSNHLVSNCDRISSMSVIDENAKGSYCIYEEVYSYKDKLYTLCECCTCGKLALPIDCDGESLCGIGSEECFNDFYENAEYLFSVVE